MTKQNETDKNLTGLKMLLALFASFCVFHENIPTYNEFDITKQIVH